MYSRHYFVNGLVAEIICYKMNLAFSFFWGGEGGGGVKNPNVGGALTIILRYISMHVPQKLGLTKTVLMRLSYQDVTIYRNPFLPGNT